MGKKKNRSGNKSKGDLGTSEEGKGSVGKGGSQKKPSELNRVRDGKVAKQCVGDADAVMEKLRKLPLFKEQLFGKLFYGYPIEKLFQFLDKMKHGIWKLQEIKGKNYWELVSCDSNGPTAVECKELWNKLVKELPNPTFQDNLNTCKTFICYSVGLRNKKNWTSHPDWPKEPTTFRQRVREEISDLVGGGQISTKNLLDNLNPTGRSIMEVEVREGVKCHLIDVFQFLKEHPDVMPLETMEILEPPEGRM